MSKLGKGKMKKCPFCDSELKWSESPLEENHHTVCECGADIKIKKVKKNK